MCWNCVGLFVKCSSKHYLLLKGIALLLLLLCFTVRFLNKYSSCVCFILLPLPREALDSILCCRVFTWVR